MVNLNNEDILFDDITAVETILGEAYSKISHANTDCDCIDYTQTFDNEEFDTKKGAGALVASN